jgi:hypothetical protein
MSPDDHASPSVIFVAYLSDLSYRSPTSLPEPCDDERCNIPHRDLKIRPKIRGGTAVGSIGHPTHLHKRHGAELTSPRTTRTFPRHGQGAGPST